MRLRPLLIIAFTVLVTVNYMLLRSVYRGSSVRIASRAHVNSTDYNTLNTKQFHTIAYAEEFCVAFNVTKSSGSFREDSLDPITLATHTTSNYVPMLIEQCSSWNGPISVSLFVDRNSVKAIDMLVNIHRCNPVVEQKMSLHVVYRRSPFQKNCEEIEVEKRECHNMTRAYKLGHINAIPPFGIYPINVMRNVARLGAGSQFHLISDIEMVFSEGFAETAKKIANENLSEESKNLIVIRRFELDKSIKVVPRNISELRRRIDAKKAFEFHHKLFPIGHTIEALWFWFKRSNNHTEPTVWEIPYKNPSWEPQFIMHRSAPMSEESMPTRVRDQQALTYELCRANYTFLLASRLFNVHRGVKNASTHMDNAVREHQKRLRTRTFRSFTNRLDRLYPNSTDRCHKFIM